MLPAPSADHLRPFLTFQHRPVPRYALCQQTSLLPPAETRHKTLSAPRTAALLHSVDARPRPLGTPPERKTDGHRSGTAAASTLHKPSVRSRHIEEVLGRHPAYEHATVKDLLDLPLQLLQLQSYVTQHVLTELPRPRVLKNSKHPLQQFLHHTSSEHLGQIGPVQRAEPAGDAPHPPVSVRSVHGLNQLVQQPPTVRPELLAQRIQSHQRRWMDRNRSPQPPPVTRKPCRRSRLSCRLYLRHMVPLSCPIIAATRCRCQVILRVHFCARGGCPIMVIM